MVLYTITEFKTPRISIKYPDTAPCLFAEFKPKSIDENQQHIITDDLGISFNDK